VVKAEGSRSRGLNPGTIYWMDVSDAYMEIIKIKVAKWGTPKKYLKINFQIFSGG
jgi:hypothetical protein